MTDPGAERRTGPSYSAPAAACAVEVLSLLARHSPLGLAELQQRLSRSKSLVFRVLRELHEHDYVDRDHAGRYRLGLAAVEIGAGYLERSDPRGIVHRLLRELADDEDVTVNVGVLDGSEVVYTMKFDAPSGYFTISKVGGRVPANCVALGKALLAQLSDAEVTARFSGGLRQMTSRSISTIDDLLGELRSVRSTGYATDHEEAALGRQTLALRLEAPFLFGDALHGVSLSDDSEAFRPRADRLLGRLRSARDAIQRESAAMSTLAASGVSTPPWIDRPPPSEQSRQASKG